ncbi:hypothetical protein AVEN_214485-1 [Araneus ventricosus]|uniref:Uncharacterized protein n=1 Tax=Araneus ventricosus TaxID=182803 RepID=A0A4Y2CWD3_ARAVE|nr:hypothetical protein AVEN_214485-1 [Araneus ventricosus]
MESIVVLFMILVVSWTFTICPFHSDPIHLEAFLVDRFQFQLIKFGGPFTGQTVPTGNPSPTATHSPKGAYTLGEQNMIKTDSLRFAACLRKFFKTNRLRSIEMDEWAWNPSIIAVNHR